MPVSNNDFCAKRPFSRLVSVWCSKKPEYTLGKEFEHTAFSSGTQWTSAAEIPNSTSYVGWIDPVILLSRSLTQTSPWRFAQSLMKIKSHKKRVINECFWWLHGEKYPENITNSGVFAGVVSLGRPWLLSGIRKKTVCAVGEGIQSGIWGKLEPCQPSKVQVMEVTVMGHNWSFVSDLCFPLDTPTPTFLTFTKLAHSDQSSLLDSSDKHIALFCPFLWKTLILLLRPIVLKQLIPINLQPSSWSLPAFSWKEEAVPPSCL